MRTETEMLTLIKNVAIQDNNIRAAYIEGSRANPEIAKDIFQDYDIVYIFLMWIIVMDGSCNLLMETEWTCMFVRKKMR